MAWVVKRMPAELRSWGLGGVLVGGCRRRGKEGADGRIHRMGGKQRHITHEDTGPDGCCKL